MAPSAKIVAANGDLLPRSWLVVPLRFLDSNIARSLWTTRSVSRRLFLALRTTPLPRARTGTSIRSWWQCSFAPAKFDSEEDSRRVVPSLLWPRGAPTTSESSGMGAVFPMHASLRLSPLYWPPLALSLELRLHLASESFCVRTIADASSTSSLCHVLSGLGPQGRRSGLTSSARLEA